MKAGILNATDIIINTNDENSNFMVSLLAHHLNEDVRILSYIENYSLSKRIKELYPFIITVSLKEFVVPLLIALSSETNISGYCFRDEQFYAISKKGDVKEIEKSDDFEKKDSVINKILSFNRIFSDAIRSDELFKYTLLSFILFIVFVSIFAIFNGITKTIIDGVYFSTAILTTIGFGDINFSKSPILIKIMGSMIMFFGAVLMTVLNASIINILITRKLKEAELIFPVPEKNHNVIFKELNNINKEFLHINQRYSRNGINNVLINSVPLDVDVIRQLRTSVIFGEEDDEILFNKANIKNANYFLATSDNDIQNINASLVARILNKDINIILLLNNQSISRYLRYDNKSIIVDTTSLLADVLIMKVLYREYDVIGVNIQSNNNVRMILNLNKEQLGKFSNKTFYHLEHDYQFEVIELDKVNKFELINNYFNIVVALSVESMENIRENNVLKKHAELKIYNLKDAIDSCVVDRTNDRSKESILIEDYFDQLKIDYDKDDNDYKILISEGDLFSIKDFLSHNRIDYDIVYTLGDKKNNPIGLFYDDEVVESGILNKIFKLNLASIFVDDIEKLYDIFLKKNVKYFVAGVSTYKKYEISIKRIKEEFLLNDYDVEFIALKSKNSADDTALSFDTVFEIEKIGDFFSSIDKIAKIDESGDLKLFVKSFKNRELNLLINLEQYIENDKFDLVKIKIFELHEKLKKLKDDKILNISKDFLDAFNNRKKKKSLKLLKKMIQYINEYMLKIEGENK